MEGNWNCWKIWAIANGRDRQLTEIGPGPIPTMALIALCELYDATVEDFEKILILDGLMYRGPQSFSEEQASKSVMKNVVDIKSKVKGKPRPKGKK